jgi:hypothetical protein
MQQGAASPPGARDSSAFKQIASSAFGPRSDQSGVRPGKPQTTDPSIVVDQLRRRLSAQEEDRAFEILKGRKSRRSGGGVYLLTGAAAVLSAGIVLFLTGDFQGERELQIIAHVAPPEEEPFVVEPASDASVADAAAHPAEPAEEPEEVPRQSRLPTPEEEPDVPDRGQRAVSERGPRRLVANDGPTFRLPAGTIKVRWKDIPGPAVDMSRVPTVPSEKP